MRIIRLKEVIDLTSARSTIYKHISEGTFPEAGLVGRPRRLGR